MKEWVTFKQPHLASLANEGSKVYEKFNLMQCQLIDRRRFSINQFYRTTELSWCYKYEESIRKKNSKPKRPFYEDEKYERIRNFIKDSGILADLDHDPKQITALCSRLQSDLVKNPRWSDGLMEIKTVIFITTNLLKNKSILVYELGILVPNLKSLYFISSTIFYRALSFFAFTEMSIFSAFVKP